MNFLFSFTVEETCTLTTFVEPEETKSLSQEIQKFHVSVSEKGEGGLRYGNKRLQVSYSKSAWIRCALITLYPRGFNFGILRYSLLEKIQQRFRVKYVSKNYTFQLFLENILRNQPSE